MSCFWALHEKYYHFDIKSSGSGAQKNTSEKLEGCSEVIDTTNNSFSAAILFTSVEV